VVGPLDFMPLFYLWPNSVRHRPQTDHPVKLLAIGGNAEANKSRKYFLKCAQVELVFGLRL